MPRRGLVERVRISGFRSFTPKDNHDINRTYLLEPIERATQRMCAADALRRATV